MQMSKLNPEIEASLDALAALCCNSLRGQPRAQRACGRGTRQQASRLLKFACEF